MLATGILFVLVIVLTIVNVFFRFFFSTINFGWASETITMLYVWCIFVGAATVYRTRGHISIEAVMEMMPKTMQKFLTLVIDVAMLVIFAWVAYLALDYTLHGSVKVMGVLRLSYAYEYAAMPAGSTCAAPRASPRRSRSWVCCCSTPAQACRAATASPKSSAATACCPCSTACFSLSFRCSPAS